MAEARGFAPVKIGIVSDSPALTTGYGIVADQCCRALLAAGHSLTCFGFKDTEENPRRRAYPCPILPIDPFERWHPKLRSFVVDAAVDVLWLYIDIYNLEEIMKALEGLSLPPLSIYAIFDGLPVYRRLTDLLRNFRTIVVTTRMAADFLQQRGHAVHSVAPPGLDHTLFHMLDREGLRSEAGLNGAFVIGAFGRNTERKQQPRLLQALHRLKDAGNASNLLIYFHCSRRGYWDLEDLVDRWGLQAHVLFADDVGDETRGVPVRRHDPVGKILRPRVPTGFGYVERLNLCDIVLNVPHSGDFEQVLIEAPACGAPVVATDDGGVMREALGPGLPLRTEEPMLGNAGQLLHFATIEHIEKAILTLSLDRARLDEMAELGRNYASRHDWKLAQAAILSAIASAADS
jgi:glycosyltransferase involved in cell wall biosynthesis